MLEAQNNASRHLQAVGQDVQRLGRQVEGFQSTVGRGGGLAVAISGAADAFRILGAAAQAVGNVVGGVVDQIKAGFTSNTELERATVAFQRYTGSATEAAQIITALRREASVSPFSDEEVIAAGRALISVSDGSRESLLGLVQVAEQLAVLDPMQGITGGVRALQEAMGGSFTSLFERFEIPLTFINRLREEGVPNLEIVKRALEFRGIDAGAIEAFGRTFEGRLATIQSFGQELRQLLTAGVFQGVGDAFGHMVNLIAEHGDRLREVISGVGLAIGALLQRVATAAQGPLRALVEAFAPGLWAQIAQELERIPEPMEDVARAAGQAAPAVRDMNRELAEIGVAAAGLQLSADRVRGAFAGQLEPLERQLRLLQQSADLQRVQNALASNRGAVERLRLEREIVALRRAAGGAEDPAAQGLSLRQRLIALALQERELRQEELGLEEERRPLMQTLQQQIATIQEQQRQALAPLEAQLQNYREQANALQLVRQQADLARQDAERAAEAVRQTGRGAASPEALADSRARGEAIADEWLKAYEKWIDENGGSFWTAISKSLTKWAVETGIPEAKKIGGQLAAGVAEGFAEVIKQTLFPGGMPRVEGQFDPAASLPTVSVPVSPPGRPGAGGDANITINLADIAHAPGFQQRLQAAFEQFWAQFLQAEAQTDPGASARLQGAGRTP